jgi:hypothetical protein
MIATRLLILGFVTMLAGPALAAFTLDIAAPYEGATNLGRNNITDASPAGACVDVAGTCTGDPNFFCFEPGDCTTVPQAVGGPCVGASFYCRDIDGEKCKTNAPCKLERVPAKRCSRGDSTA